MKTAKEKAEGNAEVVASRDRIGLDYRMSTWVVARDRTNKLVLIGGLGALGVGQMWKRDYDEDPSSHRSDPEYADAPEARGEY